MRVTYYKDLIMFVLFPLHSCLSGTIHLDECCLQAAVQIYEMLAIVDRNCEHLQYMNAVADMLYYLKYSFIGDGIRNDVENIVRQLRPALKLRLRFIAGHSRDETPQT